MPLLGALIYLRNLPSIVVTLGMSFVWQGLAILLLPQARRQGAGLAAGASWASSRPSCRFPIIAAIVIAVVAHFGLMRTSYGAILRGAGGNPAAIGRAGWSLLKTKVVLFALAGVVRRALRHGADRHHHSADANIGNGYTLLSIAGVILGGGEFVGGRVSPIGAVHRRADAGAGRLAAAHLHAHPARLAGRRQRRHPDHRAGRAGADQPQGEVADDARSHALLAEALDLVLRRRARWSGWRRSPSPAATAPAA